MKWKQGKCDICGYEGSIDKHHIVPRRLGWDNSKRNVVKLCPNCHREVHSNVIDIIGWKISSEGIVLDYNNVKEL